MAISNENIDYLFDTMKYFDEQYAQLADNCFDEVNRALNEIVLYHVPNKLAKVVPYGSYAIKSNYQLVEPMEFFVLLPSDKEKIIEIESMQKKALNAKKKQKKSIKTLYESITTSGSLNNTSQNQSAYDVARTITTEMQKYLNPEDQVFFKNNVVLIKLFIEKDFYANAIVYIGYQFGSNEIEFSKFGYKTSENINQTNASIMQKNSETNGNYLLLCKLIKMLELELVINGDSNIYLSKKSIFIENLLYNVPNYFFEGNDFSKMLTNITNYLKHIDIDSIKIAGNPNKKMFEKYGYYANSNFESITKKLIYLSNNTNDMIAKALELAKKMNNNSTQDGNSNPDQPIKKIKKN